MTKGDAATVLAALNGTTPAGMVLGPEKESVEVEFSRRTPPPVVEGASMQRFLALGPVRTGDEPAVDVERAEAARQSGGGSQPRPYSHAHASEVEESLRAFGSIVKADVGADGQHVMRIEFESPLSAWAAADQFGFLRRRRKTAVSMRDLLVVLYVYVAADTFSLSLSPRPCGAAWPSASPRTTMC